MTSFFTNTPIYPGWHGDCARVAQIGGSVLIRAIDVVANGVVTIAMTPAQARALAQGIIAAAEKAEAHQ